MKILLFFLYLLAITQATTNHTTKTAGVQKLHGIKDSSKKISKEESAPATYEKY